ncbi:MAG TPA: AAA family ATPase [Clostridia bacterium]|nr:AAA family ATPase [Clostridia bacterium]
MKISEAKQCIKELYLNTESVSALISERGVGKTSAYQQCAAELGIDYMGLYAAALEGPDFMGLPDKDREKGITRYLAPQFLPTVQAVREGLFAEKGILVLEEINRVPSDTTSVLYPLLLERKVNGHTIAPGWRIGVTMNPDTMNYSVSSLDDAMLDRFVSMEITADLEDYTDYSIMNHPNDDILAFLQACPDMLLVVRKAADSTALSKSPTPRGWTKVQELLNNCSLNERLMKQLIAGIVGPEAAASFYGFLKNRSFKIPAADKILENFVEVKADIQEVLEMDRLDVLSLIIKKLVLQFRMEKAHIDNLNAFVNCLPEELGVLFFKLLATKRSDEFMDVIQQFDAYEKISDKIFEMLKP